MTVLGRPTKRSWWGISAGLVLVVLGALAYDFFNPSPHGLLELTIAIPLASLGLVVIGASLACGWRTVGWLLRTVAMLLIALGLAPLGFLAYTFLLA